MKCSKCNMPLENTYRCPACGLEDPLAKKIIQSSNWHYNRGLEKARVRDLSGAALSLGTALKYNKYNTEARNLLGLIYFQMGEIVSALSEWVISVHFKASGNRAVKYIKAIQDNPVKLQQANKTIQKYNMALQCLQENNPEMAIIELKNVVNMSPTYVRAYQLLGLLYIQRKQYGVARKVLLQAIHVDRNNMTTLAYLEELNRLRSRRSGGSAKKYDDELQINDPNPVVIEENTGKGYTDYNTGTISFINVIIGIVIGAAVVWLLLVPSITKQKTDEYNAAVVQYSAQISEQNKQISTLQSEKDSIQTELDKYSGSGQDVSVDDNGASEAALMKAIAAYLQSETTNAGMALADVAPDAITDATQVTIYQTIRAATKDKVTNSLYTTAYQSYQDGDFMSAIEGFIKVLRMDETYTEAIFFEGRAYQQLADTENAAACYQTIVNSYPNSSRAEEAQKYLNNLGVTAGNGTAESGVAESESDNETNESDTVESGTAGNN